MKTETATLPAKNNRRFIATPAPLVWDVNYSSYWWIIETNPAVLFRGRKQVERIIGYSQAQRNSEPLDKEKLLRRIVTMFNKQGYLDRCKFIHIYRRCGLMIDSKKDFEILLLSPSGFVQLHEDQRFTHTEELFVHLRDTYNQRKNTGVKVEEPLPRPKEQDKELFLDIDFQFLRLGNNSQQLDAYGQRLLRNGHSMSDVVNFYNAYKKKYL